MLEPEEAARIQLLFRQVNERIQSVGTDLFGIQPDEPLSVLCECAELGCVERIQIPARDLQRARRSPESFVVLPGHEGPNPVTVDPRPGYVIATLDAELVERVRGAA